VIKRHPKDGHVHCSPATGEPSCIHCDKPPPKNIRVVSLEKLEQWRMRESTGLAPVVDIQTRRAGTE